MQYQAWKTRMYLEPRASCKHMFTFLDMYPEAMLYFSSYFHPWWEK